MSRDTYDERVASHRSGQRMTEITRRNSFRLQKPSCSKSWLWNITGFRGRHCVERRDLVRQLRDKPRAHSCDTERREKQPQPWPGTGNTYSTEKSPRTAGTLTAKKHEKERRTDREEKKETRRRGTRGRQTSSIQPMLAQRAAVSWKKALRDSTHRKTVRKSQSSLDQMDEHQPHHKFTKIEQKTKQEVRVAVRGLRAMFRCGSSAWSS